VLVLVAGTPLFLCMPPWNDVTLHDMVARTVLRGGVQYRDVFDTNLPGIDWAMALVRFLFGWSYEVLRAADLVVIGAIVAVLAGWVRRCGATGYAAAWFVVAASLFYPFQSEFTHVQRDPWMLLPAAIAARLRLRRVWKSEELPVVSVRPSILEGFVWGLAVWVKPHVIIPAFAVWVVSAVLLARREARNRILADLGGLILGGLLAGAPGVAWLVATGAWEYFLDIFLNWNPDYLSEAGSLTQRWGTVFTCFPPWSVLHHFAIPVALLSLWEARVWSRRPSAPARVPVGPRLYLPAERESVAAARALLAALYLAWLVQAVLTQKAFDYVHTPLTFLAMAVIAGQRWCFGFAYLVWFVLVGLLVNVADEFPAAARLVAALEPPDSPVRAYVRLEKHPLADGKIMKLWPRCWIEGSSPELRDQLGQYTDIHCGTKWRELEDVAAYLRGVDPPIGPGELNCWHDSTHPLYLMLDLDPATRYMHYGTAFGIRSKRAQIADEVRASRQKYVVSDLLRTIPHERRREVYAPESWRAGDPLPVWLPSAERRKFPWNQPVVFRSGRYLVHKIDPKIPLGVIRVADWELLDRLGELGPEQ
jgi:hypothetical protein